MCIYKLHQRSCVSVCGVGGLPLLLWKIQFAIPSVRLEKRKEKKNKQDEQCCSVLSVYLYAIYLVFTYYSAMENIYSVKKIPYFDFCLP